MPNENPTDELDPAQTANPADTGGAAGDVQVATNDQPEADFSTLFAGMEPEANLPAAVNRGVTPTKQPTQPVTQPGQRPVLPAVDQNSRAGKLAAIKDPARREMLKQMGNAPFEYFYNIELQRQNGELVTKADAEKLATDRLAAEQAKFQTLADEAKATRFFDHEHGYKLTPEYEELSGHAENLSNELEFWNIQLRNFHEGKPVQLLELNDKGQPVIAPQRYDPKTSPGLLAEISSSISRGTAIQMDLRRQMEAIPKAHKEQFSKFAGVIQELDKKDFSQVNSPHFKKAVEEELGRFNKAMQARPEIQLLAKYKTVAQILFRKINEMTAAESVRTNANASKIAAAPSTSEISVPTAAAGDDSEEAGVAEIERIVSRRR